MQQRITTPSALLLQAHIQKTVAAAVAAAVAATEWTLLHINFQYQIFYIKYSISNLLYQICYMKVPVVSGEKICPSVCLTSCPYFLSTSCRDSGGSSAVGLCAGLCVGVRGSAIVVHAEYEAYFEQFPFAYKFLKQIPTIFKKSRPFYLLYEESYNRWHIFRAQEHLHWKPTVSVEENIMIQFILQSIKKPPLQNRCPFLPYNLQFPTYFQN